MDDVRVQTRGGIGAGHYRPLLVWLAVALLLFLAGCSGAPASAEAEDARPVMTHDPHPTSYAKAVPESDEVVLRWNGTLVLPGEAEAIR